MCPGQSDITTLSYLMCWTSKGVGSGSENEILSFHLGQIVSTPDLKEHTNNSAQNLCNSEGSVLKCKWETFHSEISYHLLDSYVQGCCYIA